MDEIQKDECPRKISNDEDYATNNNKWYQKLWGWIKKVTRPTDWIIAICTIGIMIVGFLQWWTLDKTNETSRLRDRAFIYFTTPTFRPYPPVNPIKWAIEINLANTGAMPAKGVVVKYKCIVGGESFDDPFNSKILTTKQIGGFIGPHQSVSFLAHQGDFTPEVEEIIKGNIRVYVIARVEYKDGFDFETTRITEISRRMYVDAAYGYSFHLAGPHNCAEEDCPQ